MTNYENIKRMNIQQMAFTLYALILPFIEEQDEALKKEALREIIKMLNSEVGK